MIGIGIKPPHLLNPPPTHTHIHTHRQATDPKIMDVKKRVRDVRRKLKRESKVQLSDEIIFFDDIAGNKQAKVGGRVWGEWGVKRGRRI